MKFMTKTLAILMTIVAVAGCENMSRSQKNTAVGAAIGGTAGYMLGGNAATTLGGARLEVLSVARFIDNFFSINRIYYNAVYFWVILEAELINQENFTLT